MRAFVKMVLLTAVLLVAGERSARVAERRASVSQTPASENLHQGVCKTDALQDEAIARVLALPAAERLDATSALIASLADRPEEAVRVTERLCRDDSTFRREHGNTLIAVLSAAGAYERAVAFAAAGGPERGEWLTRAFRAWSERAPVAAAEAALAFDGDDAMTPVFTAWAARDPMAAARFATRSPEAHAAAREALMTALDVTDGADVPKK